MVAFQVIGSLVLILGGLVLVLQLLKKYVPAMAAPRDLSVIEQLHLGRPVPLDGREDPR